VVLGAWLVLATGGRPADEQARQAYEKLSGAREQGVAQTAGRDDDVAFAEERLVNATKLAAGRSEELGNQLTD